MLAYLAPCQLSCNPALTAVLALGCALATNAEQLHSTQVGAPYHARVLIPCYREPLHIIVKTINAAYDALLPHGCHRTVYVCDDGQDPKLRRFCRAMGPSVVYVSGRRREVQSQLLQG